jgi:hypothetical protein
MRSLKLAHRYTEFAAGATLFSSVFLLPVIERKREPQVEGKEKTDRN